MEVIFGGREPGDILFVAQKVLTAYDTDFQKKKKAAEKIDFSAVVSTKDVHTEECCSS